MKKFEIIKLKKEDSIQKIEYTVMHKLQLCKHGEM